MPNVRCRYYEEDGTPIAGGCRRTASECEFVHPSSPQWRNARPPKVMYQPLRGGRGRGNSRGGRPRDDGGRDAEESRDSGWGGRAGRGDGGGGGGGGWGSSSNSGRGGGWGDTGASSSASQQPAAAASGWGESFGGSSWDSGNAAGGSNQAGSSSASVDPTLDWGAPTDWGAPAADWGAPASAPAAVPDWGAPPQPPGTTSSGWGDPPATSASTAPAAAGQQSPDREKKAAEAVIWGDPAKAQDVPSTPANMQSTPQWATPRTPRSPDRSPQRERAAAPTDPRRRPPPPPPPAATSTSTAKTASVAMSASDEAAQSVLAKEGPQEETRTLSWGVPAPVPAAGRDGSSPATNPFAFTDYTPATRIDVDPPEPAVVLLLDREVNMEEAGGSSRTGSRQPSRASSPVPPVSPVVEIRPKTTLDKWKDYIRLLTKAVSLSLDLAALNDTQAKHRAMQRSQRYRSASMAAAHAQLERVRGEHDTKLRRAQRKFDDCLDKLVARFPPEGPPVVADPVLPVEVEGWRAWAAGTMAWVEQVRPLVEQRVEAERAAVRARMEEEAKRMEEEEAKLEEAELLARAREEAKARIGTVAEKIASLEEGVADLEYQVEALRTAPMNTPEVVLQVLRSRKDIVFSFDSSETSQQSIEEGKVPPPPPKTHAQLSEECARLEAELEDRKASLAEVLRQIEEEKAKSLSKKIAYHQLAGDMAEMQLQLKTLLEQQQATLTELQAHVAEITSLRAQLQAHEDRQPPPPPPTPTLDELERHLLPALQPELRAALHEGLGAVRRGVEEALARQQEDICAQVCHAYQPVMRLIQRVKSMSDHQPDLIMPPPAAPVQSINVQHS